MDPYGRGPAISFLRVPEGKLVNNRCHLDLRPTAGVADPVLRDDLIRATVADLTGISAAVIDGIRAGDHLEWLVMTDPEGNEFCVA